MGASRRTPTDPQLELRVRAILDATDPAGHPIIEMPDEVQDILLEAAAEANQNVAERVPGIGLVLGGGVVARMLEETRRGAASPSATTHSRLDRRG